MNQAEKLAGFEHVRPLSFSVAYRILGSVAEAEDPVQETWLRWDGTETVPESLRAFLSAGHGWRAAR